MPFFFKFSILNCTHTAWLMACSECSSIWWLAHWLITLHWGPFHPDCMGSVTSEGGWGPLADFAAAVNQVPSCHELRLDKSRTEVWTNWPLPLLVLLFLLFLYVSQIRFNSVFLFEDWRDLSVSLLPTSTWRFDLSLQIASFCDCKIKACKRLQYKILALATFTCPSVKTYPYPKNYFESSV